MRKLLLVVVMGLQSYVVMADSRCVTEVDPGRNNAEGVILVSNFRMYGRTSEYCDRKSDMSSVKKKTSAFAAKAENFRKDSTQSALFVFLDDDSKQVDSENGTWFNFDRVKFSSGSSALSAEAKQQLDDIAAVIKQFPKSQFKIGGYTDNTGSENGNRLLSDARAQAVFNYLSAQSISDDQLSSYEGYGSKHPVASNDTADGRAQNRRMAVRVLKK